VKNTGARRGAEVVQVYLHAASVTVTRPEQELRAFAKVDLAPGEEREVALNLPLRAFAYFDPKRSEGGAWRIDPGTYELRAASTSRDIRLRANVTVPTK
jgi:beta-glucosidase